MAHPSRSMRRRAGIEPGASLSARPESRWSAATTAAAEPSARQGLRVRGRSDVAGDHLATLPVQIEDEQRHQSEEEMREAGVVTPPSARGSCVPECSRVGSHRTITIWIALPASPGRDRESNRPRRTSRPSGPAGGREPSPGTSCFRCRKLERGATLRDWEFDAHGIPLIDPGATMGWLRR